MASFREMCFTPAEFAQMAKIDRNLIPKLEESGILKTIKKRVGNVDRKMIALEDMQNYFRAMREIANGRHGDRNEIDINNGTGATAAGNPIPVEAASDITSVA